MHVAAPPAAKDLGGEELLQLLGERRLRHTPAADAQQFDFVVQRRVLAVVQRAHHIVRRRERVVPVQLAARQADEVRGVQPRVLRVDRHEHLHDVIFGKPVEDDGRDAEVFVPEALDVGVQGEQAVLAVNRAQDAFALGHLQDADALVAVGRLKRQLLVARDDDGARNRRQVARQAALLVVLHELVDLLPNDLALVSLFARRDAPFEEVPVHLRGRGQSGPLAAAHARLPPFAVAQNLEPDELIYVTGSQGSLVELHAELLHANRGNIDHRLSPSRL